MRNCTRKVGDTDEWGVKQLSMPQKGKLPGQNNNTKANCSGMKGTVVKSKATAPNFISGTFYLFDIIVSAMMTLGQPIYIFVLHQ